MELIIASANVTFAKRLKEEIQKQSNEVESLEIISSVDDLIESLRKNPKVTGIILKTDLAKKLDDLQLELLSDVVYSIRKEKAFEHLVITVISDFKAGHPLLAELFEMGIYNFYARDETTFTVENLIETIKSPMSFSMALKYRNVSKDIPWRRDLTKKQTQHVKFESNEVLSVPTEEKPNNEEKRGSLIKIPKIKNPFGNKSKEDTDRENEQEVEEHTQSVEESKQSEPEIEFEPEPNMEPVLEVAKQPQIITQIFGTVVIGVAAVETNLGATHFSISLAKYLSDNGYNVALVEANESMDFDRIHSLSEGESRPLKEREFSLKGIKHIKYHDYINLGEIYTTYQYVILDLGHLRHSPLKHEFTRAHLKCVIASTDEWKFHWIEEFLLNNSINDLMFIIPGGSKQGMNDLASRLKKYDVFPTPINSSPYLLTHEHDTAYQQILKSFLINKKTFTGKRSLILTGIIGAALATVSIILVNLLI